MCPHIRLSLQLSYKACFIPGENLSDHGLGDGHESHSAGAEQRRGAEQHPELGRLHHVGHVHVQAAT